MKRYEDKKAVIRDLASQGIRPNEIARRLNLNLVTVRNYCYKYNLLNNKIKQETRDRIDSISALAAEGLTRREIAERLNITYHTVEYHDIKYKLCIKPDPKEGRLDSRIEDLKAMVASGMTQRAIARALNCHPKMVSSACIKHKIKPSFGRTETKIDSLAYKQFRDLSYSDYDNIKEMAASGCSQKEIAKHYGVNNCVISKFMIKYDIKPAGKRGRRFTT